MSIPNEALQKEIEAQAVMSQREISVAKAGIASKQREIRMIELTSTELKELPADTKLYEGVGKIPEVEKRLATEAEELKTDISNLNKKLHYLETTFKNSTDRINQILKPSG